MKELDGLSQFERKLRRVVEAMAFAGGILAAFLILFSVFRFLEPALSTWQRYAFVFVVGPVGIVAGLTFGLAIVGLFNVLLADLPFGIVRFITRRKPLKEIEAGYESDLYRRKQLKERRAIFAYRIKKELEGLYERIGYDESLETVFEDCLKELSRCLRVVRITNRDEFKRETGLSVEDLDEELTCFDLTEKYGGDRRWNRVDFLYHVLDLPLDLVVPRSNKDHVRRSLDILEGIVWERVSEQRARRPLETLQSLHAKLDLSSRQDTPLNAPGASFRRLAFAFSEAWTGSDNKDKINDVIDWVHSAAIEMERGNASMSQTYMDLAIESYMEHDWMHCHGLTHELIEKFLVLERQRQNSSWRRVKMLRPILGEVLDGHYDPKEIARRIRDIEARGYLMPSSIFALLRLAESHQSTSEELKERVSVH